MAEERFRRAQKRATSVVVRGPLRRCGVWAVRGKGVMDTGDIADARFEDREPTDDGEEANALEGGPDDDLDDVYADPGDVVESDLG